MMAAAAGLSSICYNHPDKKADFKCFDCKLGKTKSSVFLVTSVLGTSAFASRESCSKVVTDNQNT